MSGEDKLRFLHHFPDPDRAVVGAGCHRLLPLEAVDGCHSVLVTKPCQGGGRGEGGGGRGGEEETRECSSKELANELTTIF